MSVEGISSSQIDSMLALLRTTAAKASPPSGPGSVSPTGAAGVAGAVQGSDSVATVSFADALKNSLNQVNEIQQQAQTMGDQFASGNSNLSLSDVMIATQKANISLQTTVQVRNKMVAAYNDIMNMQI